MKRFYFSREILEAVGRQYWYIDAENILEAKTKTKNSEGIFIEQEFDVNEIGPIEWEDKEGEDIK